MTSEASADADARLDVLLAAEWRDHQERHPVAASLDGVRAADARWDDRSPEALAAEAAHQRDALARFERFARAPLSEAGHLNRELYAGLLRDALRGYELGTHLFALSPRDGVQTFAQYASLLPFARAADYEGWLARLETYPRAVEQTIALLREAIARGLLWPRSSMERLPAQLDRLLAAPEASPFYAPFARLPAALAGDAGERWRERARAAIAGGVSEALRALRAFVVEQYLPAAPDAVGLSHLPGGDELYAYHVRTQTTTGLTPDQIHELGLREVARIRAALEELAPRTGYRGSLREVFTQLREDPANYHATPEALLLAYRDMSKRIDPELVRVFSTLPRLPYGVVPIDAAIAPDTTTAYYHPGALDGSRAGMYYVNLYRPEMRPIYEIPVLSLHEAVPGHHLQIALAQELSGLPAFRRATLAYTAYTEGWGLYSEALGDEMGLYENPKDAFGALTYEMWRAVRLVVDTGLHARGWTRERAVDYFLANAAKTRLDVENEIDRYITMPGQALAYKIGQLEILALRARAEATLGAAFDLRAFHQVILGQGALPLDVLARIVDGWLARASAPARTIN